MDLTARLNPSNARWSDGSVEYIRVTVKRSDGDLDEADVTGIQIASYDDDPDTWLPPVGAVHSDTENAVTVKLLVGTTVQPAAQRWWVWVRVQRDGETVYRRCNNSSLDFTGNSWTGSGGAPVDHGDGTSSFVVLSLADNGDGTSTFPALTVTDLGDGTTSALAA